MTCYPCLGLTGTHVCTKTLTPTFAVWYGDANEDIAAAEEDRARKTGFAELDDAVEEYADHYHTRLDGYESRWPVTFMVRDLSTGKLYEVEVERDFDPVFNAGRPTEIDADARRAARWWNAFLSMWKGLGVRPCRTPCPREWGSGHWREWHRGHGCNLDPDLAAELKAAYAQAER